MKKFFTRQMLSPPDFSSKHILFRLLQTALIMAFVFMVLALYTFIANNTPALLLWADGFYRGTRSVPYLVGLGISGVLPCLAALMALAVPAGLLLGSFRPAPKVSAKKLKHAALLTGALLLLALLGNYFLCLPSMAAGYLLPNLSTSILFKSLYSGTLSDLDMSSWPANFTLYFSLVFVLTARLVKLLRWHARTKKAASAALLPTQAVSSPPKLSASQAAL